MFRSSLEADVAENRRVWYYRTEHDTVQGTIDLAILGFIGTAGPRHIKDVGDISDL